MENDVWQIYAVRYASHERKSRENFLGTDPHDDSPMPMDYFVWALVCGDRSIVVDTGFDEPMARQRGRQYFKSPDVGLREIGIDAATVKDVVITHMHYDHCGNHNMFPYARYHVQDREMNFCTGRAMTHSFARWPFEADDVCAMIRRLYSGRLFEADDVCAMIRRLYSGRLVFHDGDSEITPGVTLHHVGGHTMGMQIVRVNTRRGFVVLASDASHYYENMEREIPYPIAFNLTEVLEGYRRAYALASSREHVIPGHDPLVLARYPEARPELKGWIVRLD